MFESLFRDEATGDAGSYSQGSSSGGSRKKVEAPPSCRPHHGLCGIFNHGATCYLNSIIQTLFMTPELRESLLQISSDELGRLENLPGPRVRVIPLQLQRLFARLLLLDSPGTTTADLTDSFGWTNEELRQQHDVQELNRVLFSALEDSLRGTTRETLLRDLYHGVTVNQIQCDTCGRSSERQEDFLDLCMSVVGKSGLEDSLRSSFVETERMDRNNMYHCGVCQALVCATRSAKIRRLPKLLTVSLLRFGYNAVKQERCKETGYFEFPFTLDMSPYAESFNDAQYELFSVVVHRGSAYGGHYHAYIRDIDSLGKWENPSKRKIAEVSAASSSSALTETASKAAPASAHDFSQLQTPAGILEAVLRMSGENGMPMNKIGMELVKQTGSSWNTRFKKGYGTMAKFFKKYPEIFVVTKDETWVSLAKRSGSGTKESSGVPHPPSNLERVGTTSQNWKNIEDLHFAGGEPMQTDEAGSASHPRSFTFTNDCDDNDQSRHWFNFDDSHITPVVNADIIKQFSGKESAYMLFYRKSSLGRQPLETPRDLGSHVPRWLLDEVTAENSELQQKRLQYDAIVNVICLDILPGSFYAMKDGVLRPNDVTFPMLELEIDRRGNLDNLITSIFEIYGQVIPPQFALYVAKDTPAGLHLYDRIPTDDLSKPLRCAGICTDGLRLFFADNSQAEDGSSAPLPSGSECEPISLHVIAETEADNEEERFVVKKRCFPKNLPLAELRSELRLFVGFEATELEFCRSDGAGVRAEDEHVTLEQLRISHDGAVLARRSPNSEELALSELFRELVLKKPDRRRIMSFTLENQLSLAAGDNAQDMTVEIEKTKTVKDLKDLVLLQCGVDSDSSGMYELFSVEGSDDEATRLKPVAGNDVKLSEADLEEGAKLVLKPVHRDNLISVVFVGDSQQMEFQLGKQTTVSECLKIVLRKFQLPGDEWHLCKMDWCQEAGEPLNDPNITMGQLDVKTGDCVCLQPGKLIPKGFLSCPVWLFPTPILLEHFSEGGNSPMEADDTVNSSGMGNPLYLGEVVLSKQATFLEAKQTILSLPLASDLSTSLPNYESLRVRLIENGQPTHVVRGQPCQPIQRLKIAQDSILGVQVLRRAETLSNSKLLLGIEPAMPNESRVFLPAREYLLDTSQVNTAAALRRNLAGILGMPVDGIVMAKRSPGTNAGEWMVLPDWIVGDGTATTSDGSSGSTTNGDGWQSGKKKKKQKNKGGTNASHLATHVILTKAPFKLREGDIIRIKYAVVDGPNVDIEDFATAEELAMSKEKEKEKNVTQQQNKGGTSENSSNKAARNRERRPEVEMRIKVGDFR